MSFVRGRWPGVGVREEVNVGDSFAVGRPDDHSFRPAMLTEAMPPNEAPVPSNSVMKVERTLVRKRVRPEGEDEGN